MIAFCFALASALEKGDGKGLLYSFLWMAGDLIGMLIALFFYEKFFLPNVEYTRNLKREQQEKDYNSLLENT